MGHARRGCCGKVIKVISCRGCHGKVIIGTLIILGDHLEGLAKRAWPKIFFDSGREVLYPVGWIRTCEHVTRWQPDFKNEIRNSNKTREEGDRHILLRRLRKMSLSPTVLLESLSFRAGGCLSAHDHLNQRLDAVVASATALPSVRNLRPVAFSSASMRLARV
jgi:hypothetical protein